MQKKIVKWTNKQTTIKHSFEIALVGAWKNNILPKWVNVSNDRIEKKKKWKKKKKNEQFVSHLIE